MDQSTPSMNQSLETARGPVTIRAGQEGDASVYRTVRLEALKNNPEAFGSDYESNAEQPLSYWEGRLREQGDDLQLFFAEHNGSFAGMCGVTRGRSRKTRHTALIISVYVQPQWRGQGIADALLAACFDWARARGVLWVKLAVVTTNTAAIRCYERNGFSVYGVEPKVIFHEGVYYDELLMLRPVG